ncbi:MAG TPA: DmsC/YnfH family molybdoenzyme membrane anchor subunit [Acidimicrobiia bacterium]|nr:DmsC/YnfH family molybdoenzyme membrane anchor subunit [Acidimicrobiia bacterium]
MTAVERFSRRHDEDLTHRAGDAVYRDLLPATPPGPGQQYAFEVDLDACSGCKACVTACHNLNGLDPGESFRTVGVLHGGAPDAAYHQTVTTSCHHCLDPACMNGCPVDAYEKDSATGIVHHLDDQCIGCGYCTLTCPYEVPRLNPRLGIVRKCDMCAGRLSEGEAPACVDACPTGAIAIRVINTAVVAADAVVGHAARTRESGEPGAMVPGAPPSWITVPTTRYRTERVVPADARAVDHHAVAPAQGHPPLASMLVLTQVAAGAMTWAALGGSEGAAVSWVAVAVGMIAMAISVTHLGRPLYAWRAVIGLSHSWVSREIVVFGAFIALSIAAASGGGSALGGAAALAGLTGVVCSAMIYAAAHRWWWRAARSIPLFLSTAVAGGLALAVVVNAWAGSSGLVGPAVGVGAVAAMGLVADAAALRRASPETDAARTAALLGGALRRAHRLRVWLTLVGATVLALGAVVSGASTAGGGAIATLGVMQMLAGAVIERRHYFTAAAGPRMPGGFR